jgi:hypothetical protein
VSIICRAETSATTMSVTAAKAWSEVRRSTLRRPMKSPGTEKSITCRPPSGSSL